MAFSERNQFRVAATSAELAHFRQQAWRLYEPVAPVAMPAFGLEWQLRPGLTFTPFANAVRCTAHCAFCSEELQCYDGHQLTAKHLIDDYPAYFARLREVLRPFQGWPLGLSLSGLEATAEPRWLRELLACLTQLERDGVVFDEKVLYTNGSGFVASPDLGLALQEFGLDRLELSRCHDSRLCASTATSPCATTPCTPPPCAGCTSTSDALWALEEMDRPRPVAIDYPVELAAFYGRRIWADSLAHVASHPKYWPVFVKSTTQKGFTGRVIATAADLIGTAYQNQDRAVHCSDVVALASEWRGFVRHGQLVDVRRYHGRWDVFPDPAVMRAALTAWESRPAGGSLDFGVTADGRTVVVECNDGFALGHYGLDAVLYAKLISARWHELIGQPDPFRFLP